MLRRILNVLHNHFPELNSLELSSLADALYMLNNNSELEMVYILHAEIGTEYIIEDGIMHLIKY